jgi:hypothetical protein
MKPNPLIDMTPEQIGNLTAYALQWDGQAIFEAMIIALTDANFHRAAEALQNTWSEQS